MIFFSILRASSGSIKICSWLIPILFYNHKKEWHFGGLIQGREEHVKNIKLSWRRRTIIFVVNCRQKLILIVRMRDELINWSEIIPGVSKKFKISIGRKSTLKM